MRRLSKWVAFAAAAAAWGLDAPRADAAVITSGGGYRVGITTDGNLYDLGANIGFRRPGDGYDPIQPGTPREGYGVSAGAISGVADPFGFGTTLTLVSSSFGANSGTVTTALSGLLSITQDYSFLADNVLLIRNTVTNVSGLSQAVLYRRAVDFDVAPTQFAEISNVDPTSSNPFIASYYGFESADPLTPYSNPTTGGTFGPADLGGAYDVDLGTLAAGASSTFDVFYAVNTPGQSFTALQGQVAGLGATFEITNYSSDTGHVNSAILAFGSADASPVPVPPTVVMTLIGMSTLGGFGWMRRKAALLPA